MVSYRIVAQAFVGGLLRIPPYGGIYAISTIVFRDSGLGERYELFEDGAR